MEQVKEHYQALQIQLETKVRGSEGGHRVTEELPAACLKASFHCACFHMHTCALDPVPLLRSPLREIEDCGEM